MTTPGHDAGIAPADRASDPIGDITVGDMLAEQLLLAPDRVFCRYAGQALTVQELADNVRRVANVLSDLGIKRGDRVATILGNGFEQVYVMLACLTSGYVWVPVNHNQRGKALDHLLANADPRLVVIDPLLNTPAADPARLPRHLRLLAATPHAGVPGPSLVERAAEAASGAPEHQALADDVVCISYTSGTTGKPKGVMLTNRMFRACAVGVRHTISPEGGDVVYVWEPLHHNGGNQMVILGLLAPVTLALGSRFSARRFWTEVAESGATHIHYLGGVLQILLKQQPTSAEVSHRVRVLWGGGCPRELWFEAERRFGLTPREVYGMTETASVTTANIDGPAGSVGKSLPHFEVAIGRRDGSVNPAPGELGEILVRERRPGILTPGYFRDPDATERLRVPGSPWLRTGDSGLLDEDGNLFFFGRLNDSVRRRGENVSAWEVESVISDHPLVAECAMIGVPAEIGEQDIKIFVRPVDGATLDPLALIDWCAARMASYQVPRYVSIVDSFEKTPTQRIKKEVLSHLSVETWDREAS